MGIFAISKLSSIVFCILAFFLGGYILIGNYAPFGVTKVYKSGVSKEISELTPKDRVLGINSEEGFLQQQTSDLVYFTTNMPYRFDKAKVKITFQNTNPQQEVYLGFQDEDRWHYETKLMSGQILDGLTWKKIGSDPYLYQKNPRYSSVEEFLSSPPKDQVVGFYNFDKNLLANNILGNYSPSQTETVISTALRGKHVFYTYVKNEPFKMWISKQDLNWYEGVDVLTIKVYKENDLVYSATIDDDGIEDTSRKVLPLQEILVENPGPELPENGIYRVFFETSSGDVVIKRIRSNLSKIVFEGPIYLAGNSQVYSGVVKETLPTKVWTDALVVSAKTYHEPAFQDIKIGKSALKLDVRERAIATFTAQEITEIEVPKNDVILNGILGYFAFNLDQYFKPTSFKLLPLTEKEDLDVVDFVLTSYNQSKKEGEWKVAEVEFDLKSAFIKNGKLSWLLKAPSLKEKEGEITFKNIEVEFSKKPLVDN